MPNFSRYYESGGWFFFTVVTYKRQAVLLQPQVRESLKQALKETNQRYPFKIHAFVLLPDHFHCVLEIDDPKIPQRISMIKRRTTQLSGFQSALQQTPSEKKKRRSGLWQPRYWEHHIHNEQRLYNQVMYCYFNPVKHGLVERIGLWPYSTFHRDVAAGHIPAEWAYISG
ncbi:transposase [Aliidiomarina minuta]|uniref:Transposase n=1 Tax=Aliidiomarina minuta TaxID=880057 RepID=A0A432W7Z2_9GAMM|nr:transposase [Aliidiomarina minuta]RUO26220.1 transposase [Aliidiomarina minuta]